MKTALYLLLALVMSTCSMKRNIELSRLPKVGESVDTAMKKMRSIGRVVDFASSAQPSYSHYIVPDVQTEGLRFFMLLVSIDSLDRVANVFLSYKPQSCDEGMKFIDALPERELIGQHDQTYYTTVKKEGLRLRWMLDCDSLSMMLVLKPLNTN